MEEYIIKKNDDGSVVSVRSVQLKLLDILKDIDALCRKYDIPYWMTGGSALGAVRHKGFIPWDDDADIGMMYEDYKRFLTVVHELDPNKYVIQCFETHKEYNVLVPPMKIRLKGTYCEEFNFLLKNKCKDCDGLFIDVFVLDHVCENHKIDFLWRIRNGWNMIWITILENIGCNPIWLKKRFIRNARKYGEKYKNSPLIGYDLTWTFNSFFHPVVYTKESVFPIQYVDFEDTKLPVPKNPKEMLDIEISVHHMSLPPVEDRKPKHIKDIKL